MVQQKQGDNYLVDIQGPGNALLNVLAFENATRRNRPNLEIGALPAFVHSRDAFRCVSLSPYRPQRSVPSLVS